MSNLRDLCRCGHVRNSHEERAERCRTCMECEKWSPAYPVYDAALPSGVVPLKYIESTGLTLVQCAHSDHVHGNICQFCKAASWMTQDFSLPVKRLVFAPPQPQLL